MQNSIRAAALIAAAGIAVNLRVSAQEMQDMPGMKQHPAPQEKMETHGVSPTYPRLGRAQEQAQGHLFTVDEAQQIAASCNPTLGQAQAELRAARARQQQAGLYPNPTVGYTGDEIRGGSVGGGKQGFFVQQTIVTGGKLSMSRAVFSKETEIALIEAQEQKLRVETAVKAAFVHVLAAQERLDALRDLAKIEQSYAEAQHQLRNTGQADETEVLAAEISARRRQLAARMQENALLEEWRALAAVIGKPDLPLAVVSGPLDAGWPELNEDQIAQKLAAESPAARIAATTASRADAEVVQARRARIPDLQLRGGLEYNNDSLGSAPHSKGWEGIAEAAVEIPVFNRKQGNVAASLADSDRAKLEQARVTLTLRRRATSVLDEYANAKLMAIEYREELLPRAKKAYTLMDDKYNRMLASYPRVIESQRTLSELHLEYIAALETVWTAGIALEGYLLTDGLESPARPGDIDHPVRELNIPMPERSGSSASPREVTRP